MVNRPSSYQSPESDSAWGGGQAHGERQGSDLAQRQPGRWRLETGLERSKPQNRLPRGAPIQLPFLATTLKVREAELGTRPLKSSSVQARKASEPQREDCLVFSTQ